MKRVFCMKMFSKHAMALAAVVALIGVLKSEPALALDELYSPAVDYREISLSYTGSRTFDTHQDKNNVQTHELSLEAGLQPWWELGLNGNFMRDSNNSPKMSDAEIKSRFQFFETGEYWLDTGLLAAYHLSTQSRQTDSIEIKILLQKDINKITNTTDIGFAQDVGRYAASGGPDYIFLNNTRYRYNEHVQPGIELQSDLKQAHNLGHFSQQEHYIGPALYGTLFGSLKYQAAYLVGASDAAAQSAARVLLEYEMHY